MQFFKGRKPKLKGFYALQSNYFEKCFPWVNTTDIAVTQAHQTLVQAGRTTQQCHTCCSDFVVMKNAKLRISWREVGAETRRQELGTDVGGTPFPCFLPQVYLSFFSHRPKEHLSRDSTTQRALIGP